jgi:hypothetical protein
MSAGTYTGSYGNMTLYINHSPATITAVGKVLNSTVDGLAVSAGVGNVTNIGTITASGSSGRGIDLTSGSFTENSQDTAGALTVMDGSLTVSISLFGQFSNSFTARSDGAVGTVIAYLSAPARTSIANGHLHG